MYTSQAEEIRHHLSIFLEDGILHTISDCISYVSFAMEREIDSTSFQNALRGMDKHLYDRSLHGTIQRIGVENMPTAASCIAQRFEDQLLEAATTFSERLKAICTFNLLNIPEDDYRKLTKVCEISRSYMATIYNDVQQFCNALQREKNSTVEHEEV